MNDTMKHVDALRQLMKAYNIDAFITPSTDPHSGEYVPSRWYSREWISGFNGSAGTAVVTQHDAALWTDSRYFLQATDQIRGTEFTLQKDKIEGTPSVSEWIGQRIAKGGCIGVDGWTNTVESVLTLEKELAEYGLTIRTDIDPYDTIWTDRPSLPKEKVFIQPLEFAGESTSSKVERIRDAYHKNKADGLLVSMLDEVAWTLNLRGNDIEYNPVFVSYLLICDNSVTLYTKKDKLNQEVLDYLNAENVIIKDYDDIGSDLKRLEKKIQIEPAKTNFGIFSCIANPVLADCPVSTMKIMKNPTEIKGYHSAMLKDGIAMVKWMRWALQAVKEGGQTELSLEAKLTSFRAEQPLYRGPSFATIMGYAAHGAIVHYEPTPETDIPVLPKGLLLCDSGGQYQDGTTDITRTLPLGPLTEQERRDYTLVLRGFINLARVHFPKGTYGSQLDCLARAPMWEYGINYLHGTGHGVGSFMNVHEGPHQFRMNYMPTPLLPTMTITDEPGIYMTDRHGVRHENTMLVVEDQEGVTFGPYYKFEQLTLCPIITSPIMVDMLQDDEMKWFNEYQQMVYDKLSPHLDQETSEWLYEVTRPI
ncbi:MAG: aminopeptidase P family protein [Bacteroidaceae bacterium]|nr:aminopeptidase P family protein [Bacteroidaceae bacterium]